MKYLRSSSSIRISSYTYVILFSPSPSPPSNPLNLPLSCQRIPSLLSPPVRCVQREVRGTWQRLSLPHETGLQTTTQQTPQILLPTSPSVPQLHQPTPDTKFQKWRLSLPNSRGNTISNCPIRPHHTCQDARDLFGRFQQTCSQAPIGCIIDNNLFFRRHLLWSVNACFA